jgi:hypothetical protein
MSLKDFRGIEGLSSCQNRGIEDRGMNVGIRVCRRRILD